MVAGIGQKITPKPATMALGDPLGQIGLQLPDIQAAQHGLDRPDGRWRHGQPIEAQTQQRHGLQRPAGHFAADRDRPARFGAARDKLGNDVNMAGDSGS